MWKNTPSRFLVQILKQNNPTAEAWIIGNQANPALSGFVKFYDAPFAGILVEAEIFGLPNNKIGSQFFAMHIHEIGNCAPPFERTGEHYNPDKEIHPNHAGDLLPLLSNQGYAWSAFFDRRISIQEIIGRSVIIHQMSDDFHTQPSGNAGAKIGCGVIKPIGKLPIKMENKF